MMAGLDWRVYPVGLVFCILWSAAFTVGKFAIEAAPPIWFLVIRFGLAFLIMWIVLMAMRRSLPAKGDRGTAIWLGVLNNAAYLGLCFLAFRTTSSGMVAMIASLMPLVTAALARPLLGESLISKKILGFGLGLGGAWYILWHRLSGDVVVDDPTGLILATIGMVCLASGTVLYKKRGAEADPLAMNAVQALSASVVLFPIALAFEDPGEIVLGWTLAWTLAYTVLVMTFGALLLWFLMIRWAGAGPASAFHFLNPGFALVIAWAALGEPIAVSDIVGLAPVALGILIVNWPSRPAKQAA